MPWHVHLHRRTTCTCKHIIIKWKHLSFNVKINAAQTIRKHFLNGRAYSFKKKKAMQILGRIIKKKSCFFKTQNNAWKLAVNLGVCAQEEKNSWIWVRTASVKMVASPAAISLPRSGITWNQQPVGRITSGDVQANSHWRGQHSVGTFTKETSSE